jgi:hypothetical protein
MRKLVPNIPFQMLLRGANGVAYKSLPDNAIYQFCKQAKRNGMDIFRVFDALNDIDQLEVGMRAVQEAGGVVEGTMCYSGELESALHRIKQITDASFTGDMLVCLVFLLLFHFSSPPSSISHSPFFFPSSGLRHMVTL